MPEYPINRSKSPSNVMSVEPYLQSESVAVAGNGSQTVTFAIDGSIDFEFHRFSYKSTGAFKIQFTVDQKQIFKTAIPNAVFSGLEGSTQRGQLLWHTFKKPLMVYRNTNLNAILMDTSGSSNTVEIVIDGVKYVHTI